MKWALSAAGALLLNIAGCGAGNSSFPATGQVGEALTPEELQRDDTLRKIRGGGPKRRK